MKEIQDREQLQRYLQQFQLESVLNQKLISHLSLNTFNSGDFICSQGTPAEMLYVLVKGRIKVYMTSPEGRTLVISIKKPLEVIGDIEYIRGIDIINNVEAVTEVHMIGIHYHSLRKYGADYAPLLNFLLDIITKKFFAKSDSLSQNLLYPVDVRFANYLLTIAMEESESAVLGQISTSQLTDIAHLLGTSYRHLNRIIQKLSKAGLLDRGKDFIDVKDVEGLKKLAVPYVGRKVSK